MKFSAVLTLLAVFVLASFANAQTTTTTKTTTTTTKMVTETKAPATVAQPKTAKVVTYVPVVKEVPVTTATVVTGSKLAVAKPADQSPVLRTAWLSTWWKNRAKVVRVPTTAQVDVPVAAKVESLPPATATKKQPPYPLPLP